MSEDMSRVSDVMRGRISYFDEMYRTWGQL